VIGVGAWYYKNSHTDTPVWAAYRNDDLGLKFDYRLQPEKYILIENNESAFGDLNLVEYVSIFNEQEYMEVVSSTIPREGPPGIHIMVFNNPQGLSPRAWSDEHLNISNINHVKGSISQTNFAGVPTVLYESDGLYTSDNIIALNNGRIYVISGAYLDENSRIRRDFIEMLTHLGLY